MSKFPHLEKKLVKAKIELMTKSVFISTIALGVKHVISDIVPTAATNGLCNWYNPQFIEKLTVQELAGLMAHECWHIAFEHLLRRGNRNHVCYNYAGDHVINLMLIDGGFMLPPDGLLDRKYKDWSTGQVYDDLIKDWKEPEDIKIMLDLSPPEAPDPNDKRHQDDVRDIIVRAHTQSKMAGKAAGEIPAEIGRVIEELVNPKMPWQGLLQKFLTSAKKVDYSWNRPNRRFKTFMPSMGGYGLSHLTFAIDTSGSETDEDLQELLSELQGIKDTFNPERMTIIDCDNKIHNVFDVDENTKITELQFTGGGGTSFAPVMEYVTEHPTEALIYFTDLYGNLNIDPPPMPVMWICNSDHAAAPFGDTIYID